VLSTPVAYITTAYLLDPFNQSDVVLSQDERLYTYQALIYQVFNAGINDGETVDHFRNGYFEYRQISYGPDMDYRNLGASIFALYDPTNGTVSQGNIFQSRKFGFEQPAVWEDPNYEG